MTKVILSLGSSLGDRLQMLTNAIAFINEYLGKVIEVSEVYESEPWGFNDPNFFYNLAISINTEYSPFELLNRIKHIEKYYKRIKTKQEYQARTLDIDIIFYGNVQLKTPKLEIPHKLAHLRMFVLKPISDIDEDLTHPVFNLKISELLKTCPDNNYPTLVKT